MLVAASPILLRLIVCALLVAAGLFPAFLVGLWLGLRPVAPQSPCEAIPIVRPQSEGVTGTAL